LCGAKQRAADRSVGVGIAPFAVRFNQRIFDWRADRQVTKCILECNQDPALLMHEFTRTLAKPRACKTGPHCVGLKEICAILPQIMRQLCSILGRRHVLLGRLAARHF